MKFKKIIRSHPNLFYAFYKFYLPIKNLKKKNIYDKQYNISMDALMNSKKINKVFFVGVPIHNNIGDLAQYYCIKTWLSKYYPKYDIIEFTDGVIYTNHNHVIEKIKQVISENDIFIFQSGYRTTDVANFEGEYAHQKILKSFNNQVVVFPQTVNFKSEKEQRKSIQAYQKNDNYIFLARDNISYETAKTMYDPQKVCLYPDIVTSLIGNCNLVNLNQKRDGILLCLRNDEEKLYTNDEYQSVIEELKNITDHIDITDTNSKKDFTFDRFEAENELREKLNQFAKYQLIITDRYHGTIFSLIANTNVIVLNSTDHKLSSGVDWFKGIYDERVTYCKSLDQIYSLAKKKYYEEIPLLRESYFQTKYYDRLPQKVGVNSIHVSDVRDS